MKKITLVFGTRPDAVKMCPLALELKSRADRLETRVVVTGQHREMLYQVMEPFGVVPEHDLSIMTQGQTLFEITERVLDGMKAELTAHRPDVLLVHGDTSTAFASALAAFYMQIPIGHVEAGLRTYNLASPYPEEFNRQAVDLVSRFFFAPTQASRENLIAEGKPDDAVFVTGNTEIDALRYTVRDDYSHAELDWAAGSRLALMTAHRRENLGDTMRGIFTAVRRVLDENPDVKIIYPVHLNPAVQSAAQETLRNHPRVHLINPLGVADFHNFIARSHLVLTDSGGIQESAPALGKPVLVLRDTTERPEGVAAGTLLLAGTGEAEVYREFTRLLGDSALYKKMSDAENPYGDGFASKRIADILESAL
ncbi:MAG: UDP-N-acetylglucosamine 2-epimerase (non-hydrolyzing) [Oscillospiraceae bacterium]|jgi:UDP-N-acetylglucosamine 2-epimerase (non-hydrolysing)|nr:UDP-N-acetylglucosamine 2-epimerase (non-hydrolyzing) [Oscillospiraceae bacterium]